MRRYIYLLYLIIPLSNLIFPMEQKPHPFGYWIGIPEYSQLTFPGYCAPETLPQVCRIIYGYYTTHPAHSGHQQPSRPYPPGPLHHLSQNPTEQTRSETVSQQAQKLPIPAVIHPQTGFMQTLSDSEKQVEDGAWLGIPEYSQLTFPGYCAPERLPPVCRIIYGYYTTHPTHSAQQPSRPYSPLQLNQLTQKSTEHIPSVAVVHRLQKSAIGAVAHQHATLRQNSNDQLIQKSDPAPKEHETDPHLKEIPGKNQDLPITPLPPPLPLTIGSTQEEQDHDDDKEFSLDNLSELAFESSFLLAKSEQQKEFIGFSESDAKKAIKRTDNLTAQKHAWLARKKSESNKRLKKNRKEQE